MGHVMRNTFVWTCLLAVPFEAITFGPSLCPTNKIAPHKRIASWNRPGSRTFATYYDLLTPSRPQSNPSYPGNQQNQQQEQPQEDQSDDCGDIDDYDENDLSSLYQQTKRQDRTDNRFFFGGLFNNPPQPPHQLPPYQPPNAGATKPTARPPRPGYPPARPPYWSGGVFSNNQYRPPQHEIPSDNFKPVHETAHYSDVPQTYRPGVLVGGPIGHVVGVTQARPTTPPTQGEVTRRRQEYLKKFRPHPTHAPQYPTRGPRPRKLTNDNSVIGSFIDLLFK